LATGSHGSQGSTQQNKILWSWPALQLNIRNFSGCSAFEAIMQYCPSIRMAFVLLGSASVIAVGMPLHPAEAKNHAMPKVAEARVLEAGTARLFGTIQRKIERRHELVYDSTANLLSCDDKYPLQIEGVHCENGWDTGAKN
jgi:hypothetical protein